MSDDDNSHFVVRCRGLPWSTTVDEITNFFEDCVFQEGNDSVHMTTTREGRPSGEAYIELATEEDLEKALAKDKKHMGKRYIEVFRSKYSEMDWVVKRSSVRGSDSGFEQSDNGGPQEESVVRLRGLPFDSTKMDIVKFFDGMEITNNGILMTTDYQGRSSGEAYVQFTSKPDAERALEKNKQCIGHRYIEVFRSSSVEAQRAQFGGGGGGGGQGGGYGGRGGGRGGGGRDFGGQGMRGGRPGPYERSGPPLGRGFGPNGPGARAPRGMKSYSGGYENNDYGGGYGGRGGGFGNYDDDNNSGYGMGYGNSGGGGGGRMGGRGGGFGGYGSGGSGGSGGFGRGGGGGGAVHIVHMRGLPFRVTENDIAEWFSSVVDPMDISIIYNNQGRPTGEADVMFPTESDAQKAMTKDRQNMQHRYIELFYDGAAGGGSGGNGSGGGRYGGTGPPPHAVSGAAYSTGTGAFGGNGGSRGGNGFGNGYGNY